MKIKVTQILSHKRGEKDGKPWTKICFKAVDENGKEYSLNTFDHNIEVGKFYDGIIEEKIFNNQTYYEFKKSREPEKIHKEEIEKTKPPISPISLPTELLGFHFACELTKAIITVQIPDQQGRYQFNGQSKFVLEILDEIYNHIKEKTCIKH